MTSTNVVADGALSPPPVGVRDKLTAPFWEAARGHRLVIQRCRNCQLYIHLPRSLCRRCHSFDLGFEPVSGRGRLYSFTRCHRAFHPYFADRVPYFLAVIELEEQPALRLLSMLVDATPEDVHFDMPVEVGFEALSDDVTVPVFRPAAEVAR